MHALAAASFAAIWPLGVILPFALGYSRGSVRLDALHEVHSRRAMMRAIEEAVSTPEGRPPSRRDLVAALGLSYQTVRYHLDRLIAEGLVKEVAVAWVTPHGLRRMLPLKHYIPRDEDPARHARACLLDQGSNRAVHELFLAHPGMSLGEASRALGMSRASVHLSRRKLVDFGLLPRPPWEAQADRRRTLGGGRASALHPTKG